MKKILLLSCISCLFATGLMAQSNLQQYNAHSYITGNNSSLQHSDVKIINTGTDTITINVSQDNFSANPNHVVYFCWGVVCYPPTVSVSYSPVVMAPGDTNTSFICYLQPNGYDGLSTVTYNFFNVADESDSVSVTFTYDITTGINKIENKATVSAAYPNPASGLTKISYDLKTSKNAQLFIYDILGSVVKKIDLTDQSGNIILSTSGLVSGVYYYSILADGKVLPARKLVVAHR